MIGIFKYYSGTIQGKEIAIRGKVNELATNKTIVLTKDGVNEIATLESNIKVAKIGTTEYTNLNDAIGVFDENTDEEITIIRDFAITENEKVEIASGKNVTINLNGKTIVTMTAVNAITNNGTLKLIDSGANGKIESRSETIINNLGTLEIDGGTYSGIFNTNYLIMNKGSFTLTSGNITSSRYAIKNDSTTTTTGTINLNGGTVSINNASRRRICSL